MPDLPVKVAGTSLKALAVSLLPELSSASQLSKVSLVVRVKSEALIARDFGAFLEFVDHIYGRASHSDFRSYALRSQGHFCFNKSRPGSWELIAEKALGVAGNVQPLVILWLVLKYLPSTIHSLTSAYNQLQQAELSRLNRKHLRQKMETDASLAQLPKERRAEFARLIDAAAHQEKDLLPRVRRFMKASFLGVKLEISQSEDPRDDN